MSKTLKIAGLEYQVREEEKRKIIFKDDNLPHFWHQVVDAILREIDYPDSKVSQENVMAAIGPHLNDYFQDNWELLSEFYVSAYNYIACQEKPEENPAGYMTIGKRRYKLKYTTEGLDTDDFGKQDSLKQEIVIRPGLDPDTNFLTIIHESVHVFYEETGMEETGINNEFFTLNLSNHLYGFVMDNWDFLSDLYINEKDETD